MSDEQLSETEKEELRDILGYGGTVPDGKQSVHTFLHNVATAEDTTKLGNLDTTELGNLDNPIRAYKFMASFANDVMQKPELAKYLRDQSEIVTSTSLSKGALLVRLAVTQKKQIEDISKKERKESSSWFKKKDKPEENQEA